MQNVLSRIAFLISKCFMHLFACRIGFAVENRKKQLCKGHIQQIVINFTKKLHGLSGTISLHFIVVLTY